MSSESVVKKMNSGDYYTDCLNISAEESQTAASTCAITNSSSSSSTTTVAPYLWVRMYGADPNRVAKIPTDGCGNVFGFIEAIKKVLSNKLSKFDSCDISLHLNDTADPFPPGAFLNEVCSNIKGVNSCENPLIVKAGKQTVPALLEEKGHQWSVESLSSTKVYSKVKSVLDSISIPELSFVKMKNERVPRNPKVSDDISMLLYDLPPNSSSSDRFTEFFREHEVWSLISTSGIGKTRKTFEYLSRRNGIYLSCAEPSNFNFGSKDVSHFLSRLKIERRFSDNHQGNLDYVQRFIRCILLARLMMFEHFKSSTETFTPCNWLLLQLFPPAVRNSDNIAYLSREIDVFTLITALLRSLPEDELKEEFCKRIKYFNISSSSCEIPVFLDEAQILVSNLYKDCLTFSEGRPLYTAICKAISNDYRFSCCSIGTKMSLKIVDEQNHSANSFKSCKNLHRTEIINFVYSNSEQVFEYLNRFLDIPQDLASSKCWQWLCGRPRIAASFIEKVWSRGCTVSAEIIEAFVQAQTTANGPPNSQYNVIKQLAFGERSIKDERMIRHLMSLLREAVHVFMYKSSSFWCDSTELFELGCGILTHENSHVVIYDPLVIMAAFNYFYGKLGKESDSLMNIFNSKPAALGFVFEMTVPSVVEKLLGMNETERESMFGGKMWRYDKLEILRPLQSIVVPFCRTEVPIHYTLEHHLETPSCLLLSLDGSRGAEFAASITSNGKKIGVVSVCLNAKTTWKPIEYDLDMFQIHILVAFPKRTKFKLFTIQQNRVTVIIDERNASNFFSKEELDVFRKVKSLTDDFDYVCSMLQLDTEDLQ